MESQGYVKGLVHPATRPIHYLRFSGSAWSGYSELRAGTEQEWLMALKLA